MYSLVRLLPLWFVVDRGRELYKSWVILCGHCSNQTSAKQSDFISLSMCVPPLPFTHGVNTNAVAVSESCCCNEGDLCPSVRHNLLTSTPRVYLQVNHYSNSTAPLQGETSKIPWCKTYWHAKCSANQWPKRKCGRTALIPDFQFHTVPQR